MAEEMILKRIEEINRNLYELEETGIEQAVTTKKDDIIIVTEHMIKIGIPASIKGYRYLREAVLMCIDDPEVINFITKGLYLDIAKKYKTTASAVERAMSHAIEVGWSQGDINYIYKLFGNTISSKKSKQTNSQFIGLLAYIVRLQNH